MINLTAKIAAAYLSANRVSLSEIPDVLKTIHSALQRVDQPEEEAAQAQQPAVAVKRSVTNSGIICLECGKKHKTLKRHLRTAHGLDESAYRAKWALPSSYPLVAPDYAETRSRLAKEIRLGHNRVK